MAKNLVIVESPSKARTLTKYLGRNYQVKASVGHVVDLPKSKLGVDLDKDFEPEYQIIHGKKKVIDDLKKAAKDKDKIYLAPDPDREGEAIAWHIAQKLGRKKNVFRVRFNEITRKAVREALEHPTEIDRNLFDAQTARRVLDRLVGYQISPLLWKKVRRGLSAGRVQSVAVRLICEREKEIEAFRPEEYWSLEARLEGGSPPPFVARLFKIRGERLDNKQLRIANGDAAKELVDGLAGATWKVASVERKERRRFPAPPFITSRLAAGGVAKARLQPEPHDAHRAAALRGRGARARRRGRPHHLHAHRLDPPLERGARRGARFHRRALRQAEYLPENAELLSLEERRAGRARGDPADLGPVPSRGRRARTSARKISTSTRSIWNRFIACQMTPARFDQTTVDIEAKDLVFRATGQVMRFDGFIRVYTEGRDEGAPVAEDEEGEGRALPELHEGDSLQPSRAVARTALHAAAAAILASVADQGARREGDRSAVDVRDDRRHDPQQGVRARGSRRGACDRARSGAWSTIYSSARSPTS